MSRRLPVYLLIDISGSMLDGDKIKSVVEGLSKFCTAVSRDPHALSTAHISLITFNSTAQQVVELCDPYEFVIPELRPSGCTALGEALRLVKQCAEREVKKGTQKGSGDWRPLVFLLTDGIPTTDDETWKVCLQEFKEYRWGKVVACGAGTGNQVDFNKLREVTDTVVQLDATDTKSIHDFFDWASSSLTTLSQALQKPNAEGDLEFDAIAPKPPRGLHFIR